MNQLLLAQAQTSSVVVMDENKLPDSIQWMPPGRHSIMPHVEGTPRRVIINVTPELADSYNRQLQQIRAKAKAGEGDEPYFDFDHKDEARSAEVTELYWAGDHPTNGGIRARVIWTAAGRDAILGRNYRRFSPQWLLDPDTLQPLYIEQNLGGLVNRAAFKTIAPVVAKDGSAATHNTKHNMDLKDIEAALDKRFQPLEQRLIALEKPATTATAKAGDENKDLGGIIAKAVGDAIKPFADKLDNAEKETKKVQARAAIEPHIKRGAIGPQDTDTITFWENAWTANAKSAESQLTRLPGKTPSRITSPTRAEDGGGAEADPEQQLLEKAADIVAKANGKLNFGDVLIAQARTAEGEKQYRQFRETFANTGKN